LRKVVLKGLKYALCVRFSKFLNSISKTNLKRETFLKIQDSVGSSKKKKVKREVSNESSFALLEDMGPQNKHACNT
jgi:hypothetical protein